MSAERYLLTLDAEQLVVVQAALDLYGRLQMGQTWSVADHVDRADMGVDGRLQLLSALRPVQTLITGDANPGMSRFPSERARTRFQVATHLFEHVRYARQPDPYQLPLAYAPWLVRRAPDDSPNQGDELVVARARLGQS